MFRGKRVLSKFLKLMKLIGWYIADSENFLLHVIEEKALDTMENCEGLGIDKVEELQDLLFHIDSYYEIPWVVKETKFPDVELEELSAKEFFEFLTEVETQRAIERDFIFEHVKVLPIGFEI